MVPSPLIASLACRTQHGPDESLALRLLEMGAKPTFSPYDKSDDWDAVGIHPCFLPSPLLIAINTNMEETAKVLIKKGNLSSFGPFP